MSPVTWGKYVTENQSKRKNSVAGRRRTKGAAHRTSRKNVKRHVAIIGGSIVALILIAAGIGYGVLVGSFNEVKRVSIEADPSLKRPPAKKTDAINVLLLGSDSRTSMSDVNDLRGFRSDVIMVAQISPDRKHATVMSIMRDNWVDIQGYGPAKINAAFSYGGLPLATNTIENFIGARIDHVAIVDFESFKGLTDAVNGVTVVNEIPFSTGSGNSFAAGPITLNGNQSLDYVRERYAFSDGDYQRVKNQQSFLRGLLSELVNRETLSNPGRIGEVFQALKPYLIIDEGLTLETLVRLGLQSQNLRADDITFFTSPTLGTGQSPDGQSIVIPDEAALVNIREAFASGTLDKYILSQQAAPTG